MSVKVVLVDGMVLLDDSVVNERTIIAGASPGPQVDLSTLGNGALQQTVALGVSTLSVYTPANNLAKFIVQQPDASLPNAQALSALATGLVKNTTATGVLSIGIDGVDYFSPATAFYPSGGTGPSALGGVGVATTLARGDQTHASYRSDLPLSASWFIDPVSGSDVSTNPGTTNATALATLQELKRRWWGADLTIDTTVTILGNVPSTDVGNWNFTIAPGVTVQFVGSLGSTTGFGGRSIDNTLFSGSVTSYVAMGVVPAVEDAELTDTSIPVSFTASGLMASGVIFKRTNSTAWYWYAAKDLGSKTIRVSIPQPTNITNQANAALTPGDTYTAYQMWTMPSQKFGPAGIGPNSLIVDSVMDNRTGAQRLGPQDVNNVAGLNRRTWLSTSASSWPLVSAANCVIELGAGGGLVYGNSTVSPAGFTGGGMVKGTGTSLLTFFGFTGNNGPVLYQAAGINVIDNAYYTLESPAIFCDLGSNFPAINVFGYLEFQSSRGYVTGKGNAGPIISVGGGGHANVSLTTAGTPPTPPFVAGFTSYATPVILNGVQYTVGQVPPFVNMAMGQSVAFPSQVIETGANTLLNVDAVAANTLLYRNGTLIQGATVGNGLLLSGGVLSTTGATWPGVNVRWYALDGTSGNDANAGFSDVSSAAAGLVAKQTIAGLSAVLPRVGNDRKIAIVVRSGDYTGQGGLDQLLAGMVGYASGYPVVVATDTNSTAGAVAFAGDVNDRTYAGGTTATGTNGPGYTPVGTLSASLVQCVRNGGGAPGFSAEPAVPLFCRMRFDVATATVALRNQCRMVYAVPASDTLTPLSPFSTAPSGADVFYLEQPNCVVDSSIVNFDSFGQSAVVGFKTNTFTLWRGNVTFAFCESATFNLQGGNYKPTATYSDETGTSRTVGMGMRIDGNLVCTAGGEFNLSLAQPAFGTTGGASLAAMQQFGFTNGSSVFGGILVSGTGGPVWNNLSQPACTVGGRSHVSEPIGRVRGTFNAILPAKPAGIQIVGARVVLDALDVEGMGANPAIAIAGQSTVSLSSQQIGSTGNTDVGLDLTQSYGSTIILTSQPTVTGTAGDVRLGDGTIITWAQAIVGVQDSNNNRLIGTAAFPIQRLPAGTYLTDLSAGGFVQAAAGTGLLSVGLVPGASIYADGIVTGTAKLTLISAALLQAGTIAYVNSVDDSFQLQANTQTPDNITIVAALGKAGFNWVRLGIYSARWAAVTAWTLDPANVSTTAGDENPASGNLLTYSELARRLSQVVFTAPITITVISDQQPSDKPVFTYKTTAQQQVNFVGTQTVLHAGSVTSYVAATRGTPAADDNQMGDTGIPASFTASGLMVEGVLFTRTSGTQVEWWATKDLGSKTIRTSWPFDLASVLSAPTLSPGDTYTAAALPLMSNAIFPIAQEFGTVVKHFKIARLNAPGAENIFYQENWFTAQGRDGGAFYNCAFSHGYGWNANGGGSGATVLGGLLTGTTTYEVTGVLFSTEGNALTVQTANMVVETEAMVAFQINFYDCAGPVACIGVITNARYQQTVGCFGGKGNTVPIIQVQNAYAVGVALTDASTSAVNSIILNGVGYNAAALPISDVNSGSYVGPAQIPLAAGLVQSNASGILSLATIGTGLTFSGGTLSVTGPATAVTFFDGSGNIAGDPSKFQWDDTNHRIYISSTNAADTGMLGLLNLQVESSSSAHEHLSRNTADSTGVFIRTDKSRGTRATPTVVVAGDLTLSWGTRAYSGSAYVQSANWGFQVPSDATITGSSVPQTFFIAGNGGTNPGTSSSAWGLGVSSSRNVFLGEPNITTGASDGFVYLPAMAGVPVGLPTYVFGGTQNQNRDPVLIDDTHSRFYSYIGSWKILGQYDGSFGPAIVQTDASGVHSAVTVGSGLSYSGGTLSTSGGGGTVTLVSGTVPIVITGTPTTTPTVTLAFDHASLTLNGSNQLQRSALTGDVTAPAGSNVTTLTNIPNDTTMAGDIITFQTAAPVTPGAGLGRIWFDSTSKNYLGINESAVKTAMVQAHTAVAHQFLTAITLAGAWSAAQPDYSDLTGAVPAITQLTGDVAAGPGSGSLVATLATVNSSVGTFTNATLTVNGKGLITGASSGAPITAGTGIHLVASTQVALGSASSPAAPTIAEFGNIPATTASAVNLGPLYEWDSVTLTLTGSTHHTGSSLGLVKFFAPTITNASAMTIDTAGTVIVGGAPAAAGSVTITNSYALWVASGITRLDGNVQVGVLAAGGIVKAAASTGQLGIASPGTDYQAPITWPALGEILYSSGTSSVPVGNANLIVDPTFGATVVVGDTFARNQGNQLRVVPQASMVATSVCSPDTLLVDTQTVTITSPTNVSYGGGWDTVRIQPTVYVAGSAMSIASAASVKIEGDAVGGTNVTITNPYALWIGGGHTRLDGPLQLSTVTGPALLQVDASGNVSAGSTTPFPFASYKFSINTAGSVGINSNQASVIVPGDSGAIVTGAGIYSAAAGTAIASTLGTNYGIAGGVCAYRVNRAATHFALQFTQLSATVAVANGANMGYALYSSSSPFSNAWTQLGGWSTGAMNIGTLANSGLTSGIITGSCSVAAGDVIAIAGWRTDAVAASTLSILMFSATVDLME